MAVLANHSARDVMGDVFPRTSVGSKRPRALRGHLVLW